jgi:hypothetical protein
MAGDSGWGALGAVLGGDSEAAYQQGRLMGAKTEEALAAARERVNKNAARQRIAQTAEAAGTPAAQAKLLGDAAVGDIDLGQQFGGLLKQQEYGFNQQIADPNVPLDQAQRMVLTKSTNPVEPLYKVGGGYANKFDSGAGITPLGKSAGQEGGGSSAAMQYLRAAGALDEFGLVKPGWEKFAWRVQNPQQRVIKVNGVDQIVSDNPWEDAPGAPGAPPAAAAPPAPSVHTTAFSTPESEAAAAGQRKSAEEQGQMQGKVAAGLPDALADIDKMEKAVSQFTAMPGFSGAYGNLQGTAPGQIISGVASQDIANAQAALENIGAQAFGVGIQKMVGLGQLSNAEGSRIIAAYTRALNPKIGEDEARAAWGEVVQRLGVARQLLQQKAHAAPVIPGAAPAAPAAADPNGGWQTINGVRIRVKPQ